MVCPKFDSTVATAVQDLSVLVTDERRLLHLKKVLARRGTQLIARQGEMLLFRMQPWVREEHTEYQLFLLGHLIEVRKTSPVDNEYSFVNFPPELEVRRQWVQYRFAEILVTTEEGLGWFAPGPWERLTESQQAMCKPRFIHDNVQYLSM